MQEEKERQQKKESGQQIAPELGKASREEASTRTLKVKTSKEEHRGSQSRSW